MEDTLDYIPLSALKAFPKAELHRHLDGSVRPATVLELASEQEVSLPTFDLDELKEMICVGDDCNSLEEYLVGFDITLRVLQRSYAITRVMYEVCEDAVRDGVRYLEVRFSPVLHILESLSLSAVMDAVVEGKEMAEYRLPITVQIIVCGMRQLPSDVTHDLAEITWRYRHKGVCAFDLAGPEVGYSSKEHKEAFQLVRDKCIHCTLHSGESPAAGWESIQDSIRYCGANRIGHGIQLVNNPSLMQYVINHAIAIEVCITSNLQTKGISKLENHPIRTYFDNGAIVVPCTDNPTVSNVLLSTEYEKYQRIFKFTPVEIVRMIDYGFRSGFMSNIQRRRLRSEALYKCMSVLSAYKIDVAPIKSCPQFINLIPSEFDLETALQHLSLVPNSPTKIPTTFQIARPIKYWGGHTSPTITRDMIRALPKADLHCRLDGSVSLDLVWKEIQDAKIDMKKSFGVECTSLDDLCGLIRPAVPSDELILRAKRISKSVLQSKEQIERGIENVILQAVDEHVTYLELVVRPQTHTQKGLKPEEVVDIVVATKKALEEKYPIRIGVILYVSAGPDDPVQFYKIAKICARNSDIIGYGIYGDRDLSSSEYPLCKTIFDFLKSHQINVVMSAGSEDVGTVVKALHEGGAHRISGGFRTHTFPRLMGYMASNEIPIELSLTNKLRPHTAEVNTFAGNPIRLFIDNDIPVAICTFRSQFSSLPYCYRTDVIFELVKSCNLSISSLISLMSTGYRWNFQPYNIRQKMYAEFLQETTLYLQSQGFKYFQKVPFFGGPASERGFINPL
eukprot:TRINITY_DN515_c0_g6_i2.p1 TRINITY_DN515_c0_g6~~TRINITY_DN515_c0_g6_i2.p1  ORF type:complete len:791 (+),score=159.06 TRINITY_DN515_c0_g6_i2:740-3112(+)